MASIINNINGHFMWMWFWFLMGMLTYWAKRAYFLVTGPNPIANSYGQFIERCWIPLLVRSFLDSLVFWLLFSPGAADRLLAYLGWTSYGWAVSLITQVAPVGAVFGHTIDSIMDFAVNKIPWIKGILPQLPGPLPTPPPTDSQAAKMASDTKPTKSKED